MLACALLGKKTKTMSDSTKPQSNDPADWPLAENARIVAGETHSGKACRLVDNTGEIPVEELESLLRELIESRQFGLQLLSAAGESSLRLDEPRFTHIQIGENLYRLILFPFEARIESF